MINDDSDKLVYFTSVGVVIMLYKLANGQTDSLTNFVQRYFWKYVCVGLLFYFFYSGLLRRQLEVSHIYFVNPAAVEFHKIYTSIYVYIVLFLSCSSICMGAYNLNGVRKLLVCACFIVRFSCL